MDKLYGLIGKKLSHSFSKNYFTEKFNNERLTDHSYVLFELDSVDKLKLLLEVNPHLSGLNVTIPYKSSVIPLLDQIDAAAGEIGAVNTIKISNALLKGFNTDTFGFEKSLFENVARQEVSGAIVLGTGGASKAVKYVLQIHQIPFVTVSRRDSEQAISYNELLDSHELVKGSNLIINTTPLGMYPDTSYKPAFNYDWLTKNHILFDLVYNPEKTAFLSEGEKKGALTINGLQMLHYQADRAWEIWNDPEI